MQYVTAREFSKRHGFRSHPQECVREDSPPALRQFVLRHVSARARADIHGTRDMVSGTLGYIPNPANQSVSEIWAEIAGAVNACEWFLVYDLIEEIFRSKWRDDKEDFAAEVNNFFDEQNIGWRLRAVPLPDFPDLLAPEIVIKGDPVFEQSMNTADEALTRPAQATARAELREALHDLSRRPDPDVTGAVHHAMAALECVTNSVCGETGETLGQLVKRYPAQFPPPLGDAVSKMDGFASDRGRHVTEGKKPTPKEAELAVRFTAALVAFLLR
ncbi:MAG: hypothetical protein WAM39_13910 [Bryobacteraceae bacterium]